MIEIKIRSISEPEFSELRLFVAVPAIGNLIYMNGKNYEIKLVCHYPAARVASVAPEVELVVSEV